MGQPAARQAGKLKAKRANKINNPCRWLSSSAFGLIVVIQSGARKTNIPEPPCAALEMLNHLKKSPAGWLNRVGGGVAAIFLALVLGTRPLSKDPEILSTKCGAECTGPISPVL